MKIDFLNLSIDKQEERDQYLAILNETLTHGRIINGPELSRFEEEVANYLNVNHAIGVSNGTDALFLALKVLEVKAGDEVIVPCLSWLSTAHVVKEIGATPVFADINDELNIDINSIKELTTENTKAIICVHFMGRSCDMDEINHFAKENNILVIEDASQSFGSSYNKNKTGSLSDIACFSLNPMKVFGALGEAGLITTNNNEIAQKLEKLRYCGMIDKQYCSDSSLNFRMDTIQAAFLSYRLTLIEKIIEQRNIISKEYDENFPSEIKLPPLSPIKKTSHYGYTIRVKNRSEFISKMAINGIETKIQHYPLMCDQEIYKNATADKKNAEVIVEEIINLPCHENLTNKEIEYIIKCVKESL